VENQIAEKLREARALIERGWCQKDTAIDRKGNSVDVFSPLATRWCIYGAVAAITENNYVPADIADVLREGLPVGALVSQWNDTPGRTQAEVLDLFDRAIAKAEASVNV
jgi:hypothetical protein